MAIIFGGIILLLFLAMPFAIVMSIKAAAEDSVKPSKASKPNKPNKLKHDIKVLNSTIVTLKTDYQKQIDYLRDRVIAAEMNLPFPTVDKYEKEMNDYFIKVKQQYEKDNSGS